MTQRHIEHEPRDPLDFEPVPHGAKRSDGWTPKRQRDFIDTLARIGSVTGAAKAVGLLPCGAYKLRNKPGGASFGAAWDAAVHRGSEAVRDVMVDHALNGVPDPVYYAGKQVGERRRFNVRAQQWIVERGEQAGIGVAGDGVAPVSFPSGRIPHTCGKGAAKGLFPDYILRPTREQDEATRERILKTLQCFVDGDRRIMLSMVDTDEKRAAFELLRGPIDEYPYAVGTRVNFPGWAKVVVASSILGQAIAGKGIAVKDGDYAWTYEGRASGEAVRVGHDKPE